MKRCSNSEVDRDVQIKVTHSKMKGIAKSVVSKGMGGGFFLYYV